MKKKSDSVQNIDDRSLWMDFRKGEPEAFLRLYDDYVDLLFLFGKNYSKDEEFVKDCIHDLFLDLYKYRSHLSDIQSIRFYLYSSLKRKIIKEQKKRDASVLSDSPISLLEDQEESPAFEFTLIQQEESDENNRLLMKAWAELSEHQQKILFLRFNQDLSYPEIADLLEISVESVRTMVYRSIKVLRNSLQNSSHSIHLLSFLFRKIR